MKVLMSGAPGAGKGTQGSRLAEQLGVPHIASGDVVRDHVQRATAQGVEARAAAERDDLVDDHVLLHMLAPTLAEAAGGGGFVLDGTVEEVQHRIVREVQVWRLRRPLAV